MAAHVPRTGEVKTKEFLGLVLCFKKIKEEAPLTSLGQLHLLMCIPDMMVKAEVNGCGYPDL